MKMKNLILVGLLSLVSQSIKPNEETNLEIDAAPAPEAEVVAAVEEVAPQEVVEPEEINPVPAYVQPGQRSVLHWAREGATPEERAQRAQALLKFKYASGVQAPYLQAMIDAVAPQVVEAPAQEEVQVAEVSTPEVQAPENVDAH
jgi:hypothetical protein